MNKQTELNEIYEECSRLEKMVAELYERAEELEEEIEVEEHEVSENYTAPEDDLSESECEQMVRAWVEVAKEKRQVWSDEWDRAAAERQVERERKLKQHMAEYSRKQAERMVELATETGAEMIARLEEEWRR